MIRWSGDQMIRWNNDPMIDDGAAMPDQWVVVMR
jgi:hypothetical protein